MTKRKESKQNTSKHHHQQKLRKKETKESQSNQKSMNKIMMGSINTLNITGLNYQLKDIEVLNV